MKLKSSKKDKAEKKQAQAQYPKVKTFSRAYDYSPATEKAPSAVVRNAHAFLPEERPYPVVPESTAPEEDYSDPERIDLQDTLLTDESFVERVPHHRPSVPEKKAEKIAVPAEEPTESEETEPLYKTEPEAEYEVDAFSGFESYTPGETESDSDPEPESEPDSDFFYMPDSGEESDPELPPLFESGADLPAEADEGPVSPADSDAETPEPFSWFGAETDLTETQDEDDRSIAFKKKKYSVEIGKKTNLKKKLVSRPRGSLKWKSSDKKIAKVSKKGILKPKKKGKVTVRVKTKDGEKAKVRIRIRSANKAKTIPWENVGSGKKKTYEKKWSIFA